MTGGLDSTVTRLPHKTDAEIGRAARDWEAEINDIADLADLTATVVGDYLTAPRREVTLGPGEVRHVLFCVYEMNKRLERFKDAFYGAVDGKTAEA